MQPSERATPAAAFATAQSAIARGDWETFFACLDQPELVRIAKNTLGFLTAVTPDATTRGLCAAHGFPLDDVYARGRRIVESASAMRAGATREQLLRHKALVDAYSDASDAGLRGVADLAAFAAALERWMRSGGGGGSVSSRLFVDETLEDLVVEGRKARGRRRLAGGAVEDVAFVEKKDGWRVKLPLRR